MNRLLILGNGFDLAHELPTSYEDFLTFCVKIANLNVNRKENQKVDLVIEKYWNPIDRSKKEEIVNEILGNRWVTHFLSRSAEMNKTWVDFEKEVEKLCKKAIWIEKNTLSGLLFDFAKTGHLSLDKTKLHFASLLKILSFYIQLINNFIPNSYYEEVVQFAPTEIINFNYTNTFEKIYSKHCITDYIHGKASDKNEIILGFDSMGDDRNDVRFAEFLKYFQMVDKNINTSVLNKFQKSKNTYTLIFGHSIDVTDKSIIEEIIEKSEKIFILFHSKEAKNNTIKNLIKIFGQKKFTRLCISNEKKIFLIQQNNSVQIKNSSKFEYFKNFYSSRLNENISDLIDMIINGKLELKKELGYFLLDDVFSILHTNVFTHQDKVGLSNAMKKLLFAAEGLKDVPNPFATPKEISDLITNIEIDIHIFN